MNGSSDLGVMGSMVFSLPILRSQRRSEQTRREGMPHVIGRVANLPIGVGVTAPGGWQAAEPDHIAYDLSSFVR